MPWIDIIALLVLLGFAIAGATMGGTRQLLRLGAAILAVLGAPFAARVLTGPMAGTFPSLPSVAITGISLILAAVGIYLVCAIIAHIITNVIIKSSSILTIFDHTLGLALGLITAAILLFIVGHGILAMHESLPDLDIQRSQYLTLVQQVPARALLNMAHLPTSIL